MDENLAPSYDRIEQAEPLGTCSWTLTTRFRTAGVKTDYSFYVVISNLLYVDSSILFIFPAEYHLTSAMSWEVQGQTI